MSIYQVVVKAVGPVGSQFRNIHHFEFPGYVPDDTEILEFVDGVAAVYDTFGVNYLSFQVTKNALDMRRVDIGDQPTAEVVPTSWPKAGSGTGNMIPAQLAQLVGWKAPTAYPRSCRSYMFPQPTGNISSTGRVLLGAFQAAGTFALSMEEIAITGQVDAQKVAVTYGGDPRVVTAANIVFASVQTDIWATQRSRRIGVGI